MKLSLPPRPQVNRLVIIVAAFLFVLTGCSTSRSLDAQFASVRSAVKALPAGVAPSRSAIAGRWFEVERDDSGRELTVNFHDMGPDPGSRIPIWVGTITVRQGASNKTVVSVVARRGAGGRRDKDYEQERIDEIATALLAKAAN